MSKVLAIIPARGGSKAIKKKNIRIFDGKPLIYYQVKAAQNSKYIDNIIISTDDEEVANICIEYDNVDIIHRPSEISGDFSRSEQALIHAVTEYEKETKNLVDIVVFLQATSPLNKTDYIDKLIEKIHTGYDSAFCAIEDYGFFLNDKDIEKRPMRQEKEPKIRETGNCWTIKKEALLKYNNRLAGKIGYILINKWDSLEIDEPEDIPIIKSILEQRNRQTSNNYYKKRQGVLPANFEENYWDTTIDPDGNIRKKKEEKEQFIKNAKSIIDYINTLKEGKILDIGCGYGYLLSVVNNNWEKHGTELSNFTTKTASQYASIYTGDLLKSNYLPSSFDVISLYHVIEHLETPELYIKYINNLLKIGGKLIVSTPDFNCITAQRFKENFRLLHDQTHISLFSTESLKNMLYDNGFEVEKVEYPFFDSEYFTKENLHRLFDTSKISPPFYGNIVNIFAYKC